MSADAIARVWNVPNVTAEEKLLLIWLANNCGGIGQPVMFDPDGMGQFIGADYHRAATVLDSLVAKGLIHFGTEEDETSSYIWITNDEGRYESPTDWYSSEPKSRNKRVEALLERDGPGCSYCGQAAVIYEVDHFIPRSRGGSDTMDNLVLACRPCNRAKHAIMPEVFLADRPQLYRTLSTNLKYLHAPLECEA